jgi:hypothetical protein
MLHTSVLDLPMMNSFRPLSSLDLREALGDFVGLGTANSNGNRDEPASAPKSSIELSATATAPKIFESQSIRLGHLDVGKSSSADSVQGSKIVNGASTATSRESRSKRRSALSGSGSGGGYLSDLGERSSSCDSS